MPVSPTYPGVYVQELPSGNRTIVGVSTSITAFVGRALRGPTSYPTRVSSFGDFTRKFGGLWAKSPMTYAVQQYFLAGGKEALIVRVTDTTGPTSTGTSVAASAYMALENIFRLRAQNAVSDTDYGNGYTMLVTHVNTVRFDLTLTDNDGNSELYNVTLDADDATGGYHYVGDLPDRMSQGVIAEVVTLPTGLPEAGTYTFDDGEEDEDTGAITAATVSVDGEDYADLESPLCSASSEGTWGNQLRVTVDYETSDTDDLRLFNLTVEELDSESNVLRSEVYRNVSSDPEHKRYLPTVLEEESDLVDLEAFPYVRLLETSPSTALAGGDDGGAILLGDMMGDEDAQTGMWSLELADIFNLLVLPSPSFDSPLDLDDWAEALTYCEGRRAICLVDAPSPDVWSDASDARSGMGSSTASEYGAIYFPWVKIADPLQQNRLREFPPAAVVAGLIAKTDSQRGVWKAPAGLDVRTPIVRGLSVKLTDSDNGTLNPLGLNCLRTFPNIGTVIWGARTLAGSDRLASDWKYLPVRRLALYIEESLYRGLQWAVFEPNDEPLWGQIRLAATGFMHQLFRQGAFKGSAAKDAYFVKCDSETTTDADIDRGIVNVTIGFAPLKPAEFVIISIQQIAGQVSA